MTNPEIPNTPSSVVSTSYIPNDHENQGDNPFYVHYSDSPTAILVSPLLTGDNYGT